MCRGRCCSKLTAWLRAARNASLTACSIPSQACWNWIEPLHAGVKRAKAPNGNTYQDGLPAFEGAVRS